MQEPNRRSIGEWTWCPWLCVTPTTWSTSKRCRRTLPFFRFTLNMRPRTAPLACGTMPPELRNSQPYVQPAASGDRQSLHSTCTATRHVLVSLLRLSKYFQPRNLALLARWLFARAAAWVLGEVHTLDTYIFHHLPPQQTRNET